MRDTQVGAKVFRREMLDTVAPLLLIKRYAFDLEVLAVGAEFGFDRIEEVPVSIDYRFTGSGINRQPSAACSSTRSRSPTASTCGTGTCASSRHCQRRADRARSGLR